MDAQPSFRAHPVRRLLTTFCPKKVEGEMFKGSGKTVTKQRIIMLIGVGLLLAVMLLFYNLDPHPSLMRPKRPALIVPKTA